MNASDIVQRRKTDGLVILQSLLTHHCRALSKSFIPSLVVWSVAKRTHSAEKRKTKGATAKH